MNKNIGEIFECCGDRARVTIKEIDDKLKFNIHDFGGWIFSTTNIVTGLYILRDKMIKDLKSYSDDSTKIIDILNSKLRYNKEMILNSLEEDGDLQWVSWLTRGIFEYGDDKELIYNMVVEDLEEQGYDYDNEEDYKIIDSAYWKLMEHYDGDKILEEIKGNFESDLIDIINESSNYMELTKEITQLSNDIYGTIYDYILDFICENKAY